MIAFSIVNCSTLSQSHLKMALHVIWAVFQHHSYWFHEISHILQDLLFHLVVDLHYVCMTLLPVYNSTFTVMLTKTLTWGGRDIQIHVYWGGGGGRSEAPWFHTCLANISWGFYFPTQLCNSENSSMNNQIIPTARMSPSQHGMCDWEGVRECKEGQERKTVSSWSKENTWGGLGMRTVGSGHWQPHTSFEALELELG